MFEDGVDVGDCMNSGNALNEALVAFGANRGDCEAALQKSLEMLNQDPEIGEIDAATPVLTKAVTGKSDAGADESQAVSYTHLRAHETLR